MSQRDETAASAGSTSSGPASCPRRTSPPPRWPTLVRDRWGLDVDLAPLGSQQDQNFLATAHGEPVGVVKITNPAFSAAELDAQELAAARIAAAAPRLRIATTTADAAGAPRSFVADTSEGPLSIRIIEYLGGGTLTGDAYLSPATVARMGELAARAVLALADFDHPGLDRVLQWDPQVADRVVELLAPHHPDPARRQRVADAAAAAWAQLGVVAADLPRQAVHLDLTDDNVVCTVGARHPAARRAHRLRRRHAQLGRRRARDHDLVGAAPRGRRTRVGAARDPGVPRAAAVVGVGGRGDLAAGRAARRRARRERRAPGAARRRRERICRGGHRPRVADLRAGDVGAVAGHDRRHRRRARGRRRRRRSGRRHRRARPRARRGGRRPARRLHRVRRRRRRRLARRPARRRLRPGRDRRMGRGRRAALGDAAVDGEPHPLVDVVGHRSDRDRRVVRRTPAAGEPGRRRGARLVSGATRRGARRRPPARARRRGRSCAGPRHAASPQPTGSASRQPGPGCGSGSCGPTLRRSRTSCGPSTPPGGSR